jgi:origin recognition complex subunit 6
MTESAVDNESLEFLQPLLPGSEADHEDYKELVMSLIVAVYFLVLARRRSPNSTSSPENGAAAGSPSAGPNGDSSPRKMDKKTFSEMRQTALSSLGLSPADKRHGEDVDTWIALIMNHGWAKGQEWFENVPLAGEGDDEDAISDTAEDYDEDVGHFMTSTKRRKTSIHHALLLQADTSSPEGRLLPGLGTMMQDRVDWLSEVRREDYLEWKAEILMRIEEMERAGGGGGTTARQTKGKRENIAVA